METMPILHLNELFSECKDPLNHSDDSTVSTVPFGRGQKVLCGLAKIISPPRIFLQDGV